SASGRRYTHGFRFGAPHNAECIGGAVGSVHSGSILWNSVAWSPLSSFGYLGISANFLQQRSRRFRNSNFAVQNFMAVHIVTVHGFVSAFVGLHDSAVQAHPSENTFAP